MAKEMPPKNFPIDDEGNKICAKCNSKSGCTRPIMDQHNSNLKSELFEVEQLYSYENMTAWIKNALENQRCIWGVHKPISRQDAMPFMDWFKRPENKGFQSYQNKFVVNTVKDLVQHLYEKAYKNDKASKDTKLSKKQKNDLLYQINGVERAYMEMEGAEHFILEVDCERDVARCNERREFEGKNHTHPYELEGTEIDEETYSEVAELRKKCIELGLDPKTGPQKDIERTIKILQDRIDDHEKKHAISKASKKKNEERGEIMKENKSNVKVVAGDQLSKHMGNAISANDIAKILSLIKRGANPNFETPRGMRPLLTVIVNNGNPDQIAKVIKGGGYVNAANRNGLTALMLACRLRDARLVHVLMEHGADEITNEGRYGNGRTALHYCALHSAEDEAKVLYEYVKDAGETDLMRMKQFIDFQDSNGDTPLMVAARNRNGLMCYNLLKMGADPKVVNSEKRNAAYIAREFSYTSLAEWLDNKVAAGVASVETYSDLQFEKVQRFGGLKLLELIQQYCNKILKLLQGRNNVTILMCPSRIQEFADMYGDHEKHQLVNRYFFFILMQQPNNADTVSMIESMQKIVQDLVKLIREGNVYPNAEAMEKPLPWTALMCAVAMNDSRSMRLICHEGADPNYQNRHGMTALMLASQLNNIEAICELLLLGADVNVVDNEGFNAYAYAVSLPYARPLQRSSSNVITDGDNDATKRYAADEVLKMTATMTPVEIKVRVKANLKKCTAAEIKREMDRLKLLEKNGLSKVKTEDDLHHNVKSSHWRIDPEASISLFGEDCYGDADKKMTVAEAVTKIKAHEKTKGQKMRCPICTLSLPCKHFAKEFLAKEYIRKKQQDEKLALEKKKSKRKKHDESDDEDTEAPTGGKSAFDEEEEDTTDANENEVLRMQLEVEKERAQILADRLEKEEAEGEGLNTLPPRTPVKVKLRRQLHEEQQRSKELASKLEAKKNEREKNAKKANKAKDYEDNAKSHSSKHPHTPVTSKLLKELEDEKQKAQSLAEQLDQVKGGGQDPTTPENSTRAKVRKELEAEKNKTKSLENALDKTKKRSKNENKSPPKKRKAQEKKEESAPTKEKDKAKKKKSSKLKGKAGKYAVEESDEDEEEGEDQDQEEEEELTGRKNKAAKLRKKVESERRKKEEELRAKEEKKRQQEKARKEEEKRRRKEEAERKKQRELERRRKEAEKARLREEERRRQEKEARRRRKEEEEARRAAKLAKEKAAQLKAEQKAHDAKVKKEREKMRAKLMELQDRLNKKEIDDHKKHKKAKDKKSLEKSAAEYRRMKKEMQAISQKLNKTNRRANDAEHRLEEMVQLMSIKKEIEDHNSKIAEATNRKSTLAKKLLNHMGDAVLYSEAGFSEDAHMYLSRKPASTEKDSKKHKWRGGDGEDDYNYTKKKGQKSSKKGKLLDAISYSKKGTAKGKSRRKRYETSDDESEYESDDSFEHSASEVSTEDDRSESDTETSIEDVGIQIDESDDDSDDDSDASSVSEEVSVSGNETEASGYYDSDSSRPVSRSIMKRETGEKKYKEKTRVLKFNIGNKILTNLPKGEKKIKLADYHEALNRPVTADTEATSSDEEVSSSGDESQSDSDFSDETEDGETEVDTEEESEIEEESEEEVDHKTLSRKNRGKMARWMNKL